MRIDTRPALAFMTAVLTTAVVGTIVQTQISFAYLSAIGAPTRSGLLAAATAQDLLTFGPVMGAIAGATFLLAFPAGTFVVRHADLKWRAAAFALAGTIGLWTAFWIMGFVTPMPALVAAVRDPLGHLGMALTGGVGGVVYAYLTRRSLPPLRGSPRRVVIASGVLLATAWTVYTSVRPGDVVIPHADPSRFTVETIATDLVHPWAIALLPDGRRLISERAGRLITISADGTRSSISLASLPAIYRGGGNGLMDVVLDPDFAANGLIYLTMSYGTPSANGTRHVRARLDRDRIADVRTLFESTPKAADGNNGGRVAFLQDGTLILTLGDGLKRREEAQNPANHLGKLIRLDRDGNPPSDNPFVDRSGTAPEIYSLGHRNVQGAAVDPVDGSLLISEHGPRGGDEINLIRKGANYGWPIATGGLDYSFARVTPFRSLSDLEPPLVEWTPSIAPAGLAIYRGSSFPEWQGDLLVPALRERTVRRVRREGGRIVSQELLLADRKERMRDIKVSSDGLIYVLTDGPKAQLLRLVPSATRNRS